MRRAALTIAGLDPSGGAGIAADLRAFAASGVWGCAALSLTTVQTTDGLTSVHPLDASLVIAQAREVLAVENVRAIKTGALGTAAIVLAVRDLVAEHPKLPLVVDPVMVATRSTSGARLADPGSLRAFRELVGRAQIVTPNVDEAEALLETRIESLADQRRAAKQLVAELGARAALVKGGHLAGPRAVDVLVVGRELVELSSARRPRVELHGGGCTFASLIAGQLAVGVPMLPACRWAKRRLARAIARAERVGGRLFVVDP